MTIDDCRAMLAEWLYGGATTDLRGRTARFLAVTDESAAAAARREPTVGELGLCGGAPADDAMRWTPDTHNDPEEGQT